MKTSLYLLAFMIFFTIKSNAQKKAQNNKITSNPDSVKTHKKLSFNIGLDEGVPVNYVSKYSSFVTGGSIQTEYQILKDLEITLGAGYRYFLAKDGNQGLSFIPVMAGLKYSFITKFYLSGQVGTSAAIGKDAAKTQYFTYAQGVGYKISNHIDALVKYEGINTAAERTYSFTGLRIAYTL